MDGSIIEGLEAQYEQALVYINAVVASEGGTLADIEKYQIFNRRANGTGTYREGQPKIFSRMAHLQ